MSELNLDELDKKIREDGEKLSWDEGIDLINRCRELEGERREWLTDDSLAQAAKWKMKFEALQQDSIEELEQVKAERDKDAMAGAVDYGVLRDETDRLRAELEKVKGERGGVYRERNQLVAALSKLFPSCWYRDEHFPEWQVVCINLPTGQATWHVHEQEMLEFFRHLGEQRNDWDGHASEEKYRRLAALDGPEGEDSQG